VFSLFDIHNAFELSNKNAETGEVGEIKWIPISEIDNYDFAFDHDELIKEYLNECVI
jgi:hypothetical protein